MVKVGILGADTQMAGEMIRILINHPEVDLVSLFAPSLLGRSISSVHHGLIGENNLFFTDKINLEDIDFLAIMQSNEIAKNVLERFPGIENLKLVVFENDFSWEALDKDFEIGISEINRKALVRGAKAAYITSPVIVPVLISLVPLAQFLLLNSDIDVEVFVPSDIMKNDDEKKEAVLIEKLLKDRQSSFNGKVNLKVVPNELSERSEKIKITLSCSLPIEEIEKIYDQIYDDHNFTFLTRNDVSPKEVEGTQKVIINVKKPDADTLVIESVADARLRGGAGEIVHVLNLFFGLHEKTGLRMKPSMF